MATKQNEKPSHLDVMVRKIATQGTRYKPAVPGGFMVICGCLGLLLCSWGFASAVLQTIAPAQPTWIPRCPGNPHANLIAATVFAIPAFLAILLGRNKTDSILMNDSEIRITSRSGHEKILHWHEIAESCPIVDLYQLVTMTSGRLTLIPNLLVSTKWRMDLLMALPSLLAPFFSEGQNNLSIAYARLKIAMLGPGVSFPVGNPHRYELRQRQVIIYSIFTVSAILLCILGTLSSTGPALGLAPLLISPVADLLTRRTPRKYDAVTLTTQELRIERAGISWPTIKTEDIKSTKIEDLNQLRIVCKDKEKSITLELDFRSATLLTELIKSSRTYTGLRLVHGNAAPLAA